MMLWLDGRSSKRGLERRGRKQGLYKMERRCRSGDLNCSCVNEILNPVSQGDAPIGWMPNKSMKPTEQVRPEPLRTGVRWWANLRECQKMGNLGEERAE